MGSREDEEALRGENGEGEVLEVPDWPGRWWRLQLPEMRKEASPGRMRARVVPLGWPEVACVLREARGPPFIARGGRFRGGG